MKRFRPFLVLALLACWLPATTHCAMEAAEMVQATCCDSGNATAAAADDHSDAGEHCNDWETKLVSAQDGALVKAPTLACLFVLCAAPALDDTTQVSAVHPPEDSPPVWRTTWQFERRTALPVRAPALS